MLIKIEAARRGQRSIRRPHRLAGSCLLVQGTERPAGRGANRSPHDADGCYFVRACAGSGQGRDRTADTRIFSLNKRLSRTIKDYNKAQTNEVLSSIFVVTDSAQIVLWSWIEDGTAQ